MSRVYDKMISIQRINEVTESWENLYNIHAYINKPKSNNEYLQAGAIREARSLTFEVRYFSDLESIASNTQLYRIVYQGVAFNIKDYDDFMMKHKTVRLLGVSNE